MSVSTKILFIGKDLKVSFNSFVFLNVIMPLAEKYAFKSKIPSSIIFIPYYTDTVVSDVKLTNTYALLSKQGTLTSRETKNMLGSTIDILKCPTLYSESNAFQSYKDIYASTDTSDINDRERKQRLQEASEAVIKSLSDTGEQPKIEHISTIAMSLAPKAGGSTGVEIFNRMVKKLPKLTNKNMVCTDTLNRPLH